MRGRDLQYYVVFECPECGRKNECVLKHQRQYYFCRECPDCEAREIEWPAVEGPRSISTEEREQLVAIDHSNRRQELHDAVEEAQVEGEL